MAATISSPYLTTEEAAAYVRRSAVSLERDRVRGDGPTYSRLGKLVVYTREDLDQWVHERRHRSTSEYITPEISRRGRITAKERERTVGLIELTEGAAQTTGLASASVASLLQRTRVPIMKP
jgi:hypothetical protein